MTALRRRLEAAYVRCGSVHKIDRLTEGLLNMPKYGKLKVHGAEVRGLVPVAADLVRQAVTGEERVDEAIRCAMTCLVELYNGLSSTNPVAQEAQAINSRRFAALYNSLEDTTEEFDVRPKLHLAQELLEMSPGSSAMRNWTYRDEDFGGDACTVVSPSRWWQECCHCGRQRPPQIRREASCAKPVRDDATV